MTDQFHMRRVLVSRVNWPVSRGKGGPWVARGQKSGHPETRVLERLARIGWLVGGPRWLDVFPPGHR